MEIHNKATRIELFSLRTPQMRAFHMSWFAFFLCFFAWFGIAPLMPVISGELGLTKSQIGNTVIASVAITILARPVVGWLCDHVGPRISYSALLMVGSIPVMGIALAESYESFLLFRLGIGVIGASFVITQYHTSVMFAPNCVGTANATSAGWGNLGGGVTQMVMPLVFGAFVALGYSDAISWRLSMVCAGAVCFLTGVAYFLFTQDLPDGNFRELRRRGDVPTGGKTSRAFWLAAKDRRVWALSLVYAACFGIELTINNVAVLYFFDRFGLGMKTAGLVAGLFGLMNIFARTTGGIVGDKFGQRWGLRGRVRWLFMALFVEGLALIVFSRIGILPVAIGTMIVFSLATQMSEGATYSVVPFINKKALGAVSGIVGAGGNTGAVMAGFLFKSENLSYQGAFLILGCVVLGLSFVALTIRFSPSDESVAADDHGRAVAHRRAADLARPRRRRVPEAAVQGARLTPVAALRIYLGIALMIKGIYYITDMSALEAQLDGRLAESQNLIAWFVVFAHGVGGAALALGLATRWAAGLNAIVLAGASALHASGAGGDLLLLENANFQFAMLVFATLLVFLWQGAGRFSLDQLRADASPPVEPARE